MIMFLFCSTASALFKRLSNSLFLSTSSMEYLKSELSNPTKRRNDNSEVNISFNLISRLIHVQINDEITISKGGVPGLVES